MIDQALQFCARYDIAGWLSVLIMVAGSVVGYLRFFRPRRSIPNFPVKIHWHRNAPRNYPLRITVEFTNHTGRSAYVSSVSFKASGLRADPKAGVDTATRRQHLKFPVPVPGQNYTLLKDFDVYLPVDGSTSTYAPIDPQHTDEEIKRAFTCGRVGVVECFVTVLPRSYKPQVFRLRIKPRSKLLMENRVVALWRHCRQHRDAQQEH